MEKSVAELKIEYTNYLNTLGVGSLRALGRHVGVKQSTEKKKELLISQIIAVLVGEMPPSPRSRRGAPVKAEGVNPKILSKLEEIRGKPHYGYSVEDFIRFDEELKKAFKNRLQNKEDNSLTVGSPFLTKSDSQKLICVGQIEQGNNFYYLLPPNGRDFEEKILLEEEKFQAYRLKVGDVVSCCAEGKGEFFVVKEILSVNEEFFADIIRKDFETGEISDEIDSIPFKNNKFIDWFLPVVKGGRTVIVSPPKAGKSALMREMAETLSKNEKIQAFALLIEQSSSQVAQFKKIFSPERVVYTTYGEEAERHIFTAEFLLKRAKRYAETGKDVVLLIEGIQAFAKAYDELNYENEKTLSCGLSVKTLRYIKKYLGETRAFVGGGSLTIVCTSTVDTGNIEDNLFNSEIASLFSTRIYLNGEFAAKRIFPAVDLSRSYSDAIGAYQSESKIEKFVRSEYLPKFGAEALCRLVLESKDEKEFYERAQAAIKK